MRLLCENNWLEAVSRCEANQIQRWIDTRRKEALDDDRQHTYFKKPIMMRRIDDYAVRLASNFLLSQGAVLPNYLFRAFIYIRWDRYNATSYFSPSRDWLVPLSCDSYPMYNLRPEVLPKVGKVDIRGTAYRPWYRRSVWKGAYWGRGLEGLWQSKEWWP